MSEHTPAAAAAPSAAPAPLPPGMRLILGFLYIVTASIGMLLLGIVYIWSDNPNSTDTGILLLIFLALLFMVYLNLKALCAVHHRSTAAPRRCQAALTAQFLALVLILLTLCCLAVVFLSWPDDLPLFLVWVGLPALLVFLAATWVYRYLKGSPLVRAAFNAGVRMPENQAGGPAAISAPPGVLLFLAACVAEFLFRIYWLAELLLLMHEYSSPERTFTHFTPLFLEDVAILLLVLVALFACLQRPARALFMIQSALWLFLAYETYWLLRLFLENGEGAFEENGFVWASGYALSAGAFLLYFKTSALARAFFISPPGHRRRAETKSMKAAGPEPNASLSPPMNPHAPSPAAQAEKGEEQRRTARPE